ncbi:MAG: glycosyltransferase family A protein [Microbacteriaceae bacterium]
MITLTLRSTAFPERQLMRGARHCEYEELLAVIALVTSLAHPVNLADVAHADRLLQATLNALTKQTSNRFVVIVVGDRRPEVVFPRNAEFIQVTYPPAEESKTSRYVNKGSKLGLAVIRAKQLGADYVMEFDYDDFIHRDLVAFVDEHPGEAGWYVSQGLVWSARRNVYRRMRNFHQRCGTSHILAIDLFGIPDGLGLDASQSEIIAGYEDRFFGLLGNHQGIPERMAALGRPLRPLPWPAVVYTLDTSLNVSLNTVKGLVRPMTKRTAAPYGLTPTAGWLRSIAYASQPIPLIRGLLGQLRRSLESVVRGGRSSP